MNSRTALGFQRSSNQTPPFTDMAPEAYSLQKIRAPGSVCFKKYLGYCFPVALPCGDYKTELVLATVTFRGSQFFIVFRRK